MVPYFCVVFFVVFLTTSCSEHRLPESNVQLLAHNISYGLIHSEVLDAAGDFVFEHPHDVFYRVSNRLLAKAGLQDDSLAEADAQSGEHIGVIPSQVYFSAIGQQMAKFLDLAGLVSDDNVIPFSCMVVKSIEIEACTNGITDPESVANAAVYGIYDVAEALGLANKEKLELIFHLFSEELHSETRKESSEIIFELLRVYRRNH